MESNLSVNFEGMSMILLSFDIMIWSNLLIFERIATGEFEGFEEVRTELKEVFRSARRRNVQAVRVHIGSTPHRPSYVYELPVSICDADDSTMSDCGTCCQELTNAEKRTLNRHFFTTFPVLGEKAKPHDRAFLFIQTTSNVISENLEETELDVESLDSKTKRIHLKHEGCQQQSENRSEESTKNGWIRVVPFIVSSKD
ncbi:unnamed protein product, partial [Mesorhabditis belari]|uniref:Uncharacterized protein n=1 Tax=Mesorhabditis belari TaxID=2138241 RepID=A0AAF3F3U8_9BILA